jgi:hypothetical protein
MKRKRLTRKTWVRVRVNQHEYEKLAAYADRHEYTISHVVREYIRRLPNEPSRAEEALEGVAARSKT